MSFIFILIGTPYPFAPISMTVIGSFTIGIPSFFLAMEPNDKPVDEDFFGSVMRSAVPTAVLISLFVGFFGILGKIGVLTDLADKDTLSFYVTSYFAFFHLIQTALPMSIWKLTVVATMLVFFVVTLFVPGLLPLGILGSSDIWLLGIPRNFR